MNLTTGHIGRERDIYEFFLAAFTASEGAEEGHTIGHFVNEMMEKTPSEDMLVYSAYESNLLLGCIFFSRLKYEQDSRTVFILSPVAVQPNQQGKGIGQKLISFGLNELRSKGIDIAITYGDPNYYSKTGFQQISDKEAQPPLKLSFPEGWLAQSLTDKRFKQLLGPSYCVDALNRPELW